MAKFRSSRHHREILLADWHDAEELAAWYMREDLGMSRARLTRSGNDKGIDVVADGAVAQVKHVNMPVAAPVVQAALGAGHGNEAVLFFSLSGYTRQAEEFAARAGVCLFHYDIYGDVRTGNGPARELVANRKRAGVSSVEDVRLNELRTKAAPALASLEDARNSVETLATTLERTSGLENDNKTLALITGLYAQFFEEPDSRRGYSQAFDMIEAGWAELVQETMRGKRRVSRNAVDIGFGDLVRLHDELEDVERLRQLTAAQWLRKLADWDFRRYRINYLTRFSHYLPTEDEPPLEAFELKAVIDMNIGRKLKNTMASKWLGGPSRTQYPDRLFAAAQKDPIGRGVDHCLLLLEDFWRTDFSKLDDGQSAYPLGWTRDDIDRLRRITDAA